MKTAILRKAIKFLAMIFLFTVALVILGGGLFALQVLNRKPLASVSSTTYPPMDRKDCLECHAPIAEEWRQSYHFRSLTGTHWKDVREMGYLAFFDSVRKPCVNCHAPANVLDLPGAAAESGDPSDRLGVECTPNILRDSPGVMPAARSDDVDLGVDCVSCHVSVHGIVGSGKHPSREHSVVADPRFQDASRTSDSFCVTCHGTAVDAWKRSGLAEKGVTCLDCHMPLVDRPSVTGGPSRIRRSHSFPADKDDGMMKEAVQASLQITKDRVARLRITNDRVGHYLPSGGNWLIVYMIARDASGKPLLESRELLGREETLLLDFWPFNQDSRIPHGQHRDILLKLPPGHGRVEAMIRYHDWMRETRTIARLTGNF